MAGSAALDNGSNALATAASLTTDQRGTGFVRTVDGSDVNTTDTVDIGALEQHPSVEDIADQSINEDGALNITFNVGDSNLTAGLDTITVTSGNTTLVPNANINVGGSGTNSIAGSANSSQTLAITPAANAFGTTMITVTATDLYNGTTFTHTDTFVLTVNPIADTPSASPNPATTNEDTQSGALVLSRNAVDGAEVTHFKITGITNGTLFQNNGVTTISNNEFITFAQGNAGLKFTPAANQFGASGSFGFTFQAAVDNIGTGISPAVVEGITVNPVADTPSVTNATTNEDTQTTSGLVISRNIADGTEVTHFKITGITNGTLLQNDGTTLITYGNFITFAQGNAGLKFTPAANSFSAGSFTVQASLSNVDGGLGGGTVAATITVNPVADTPGVINATTTVNVQTTSGLVIPRNAADGTEVTHFKITNIVNGALFQTDGTTPINAGDFITFAQGNAGLKFTVPSTGPASFDVQASLSNANGGLGGGVVTATITVNQPPAFTNGPPPSPGTVGTAYNFT